MSADRHCTGKRFRNAAATLLLLLAASTTHAWNATGHRLSAAIAWDALDAGTRQTLGKLLARHPDHAHWQNSRPHTSDPARHAFIEASTWADRIRNDPRFHDDDSAASNLAAIPGFPDLRRHLSWHYADRPLEGGMARGALAEQLHRLQQQVHDRRRPAPERAYALAWLIHLVGDAHQPLHTSSRDGDRGGNTRLIIDPDRRQQPLTNLHAWWDDLPGSGWLRGRRLDAHAVALAFAHPPADQADPPHKWLEESRLLAQQTAYELPSNGEQGLPVIDRSYRETARAVADERIARAGQRLALLLAQLRR